MAKIKRDPKKVALSQAILDAYLVLCQEKVQIKYALLMLSYPAKASALSSNAA